MSVKRVAVVGAGVNGVSIATACAALGYEVQLFDESTPFDQTSSASSRMLHGGIRYIEQGHIGLVREALRERWLASLCTQGYPSGTILFSCLPGSEEGPVAALRGHPYLSMAGGAILGWDQSIAQWR